MIKAIKKLVYNLIANIPLYLTLPLTLLIGFVSYVSMVLLAISVETHKALGTELGVKLSEKDEIVKKVANYLDKVKSGATPPVTTTAKPNKESNRLLSIVKGDEDSNK